MCARAREEKRIEPAVSAQKEKITPPDKYDEENEEFPHHFRHEFVGEKKEPSFKFLPEAQVVQWITEKQAPGYICLGRKCVRRCLSE